METLNNTNNAPYQSNISARVRSVLTIAGIVTAIICSLILLKDIHSVAPESIRLSGSIEGPDVVNTDLLATVKNMASALTVFR